MPQHTFSTPTTHPFGASKSKETLVPIFGSSTAHMGYIVGQLATAQFAITDRWGVPSVFVGALTGVVEPVNGTAAVPITVTSPGSGIVALTLSAGDTTTLQEFGGHLKVFAGSTLVVAGRVMGQQPVGASPSSGPTPPTSTIISATGNVTTSNGNVTNLSTTVGVVPGMVVSGAGLPSGTTVTALLPGNVITTSAMNGTANIVGGTFTFTTPPATNVVPAAEVVWIARESATSWRLVRRQSTVNPSTGVRTLLGAWALADGSPYIPPGGTSFTSGCTYWGTDGEDTLANLIATAPVIAEPWDSITIFNHDADRIAFSFGGVTFQLDGGETKNETVGAGFTNALTFSNPYGANPNTNISFTVSRKARA
jgi:hypothetical protein